MATGVDFGKQVGPLPLGAWVVVVGGGLGIAWWTRRNSVAEAVEAPPADENPGVGVGGMPAGWTQLVPVAPPNQGLEPEPKTNEEWGQKAIRWLISMGFPPATSDSAIRKYLVAEQPTLQEQMLISLVLGRLGPPPQSLPPTPVTEPPPPVTQPPPPVNNPPPSGPAQQRTFTVTRWPAPGSSLWSIAQIMYGNPLRWVDIYNANRDKISNPNSIQPGWVLRIP
jgi:LysM domain-containing protein